MKLNSKYFDSIRIGDKRPVDDRPRAHNRSCQWKGCDRPGEHRAPKGRGKDGEYYVFCVDHVRQYNATYNYFDGMSDSEVIDFQKDAMTGHRPTWKVGANSWGHGTREGQAGKGGAGGGADAGPGTTGPNDPHSFFAWRAKKAREEPAESRRQLRPIERRSLDALNLGPSASKQEIKSRFKELVKQHHPDVNGGDNRSEDKLREIIQAYNYLKQAGMA